LKWFFSYLSITFAYMEQNTTIFGLRAIIEAIESGSTLNKVYLQKGLRGDLFFELEKLIKKNKISTSVVPIEKLERLSKHNNHQGAVAKISPVEFVDIEELIEGALESDKKPLFLYWC